MKCLHLCCYLACLTVASVAAVMAAESDKPPAPATAPAQGGGNALYRLGPGDEIKVQQPNVEELDGKTARIDDMGSVILPLVGRVQLGGLTIEEAQSLLSSRLSSLLLRPDPIISITEYRSQPVSVVGSVNNPGVIQLQGTKSLMEILSQAGGLRQDAGSEVQITRQIANGRVPVGKEDLDDSGQFSIGRVNLGRLFKGEIPRDNIVIRPHDVITVPRADVIYVTGDVHKPGGFPLNPGDISVLQAVSLAEGLGPQASPKNAKIFRPRDGAANLEIPVNLAAIMAGKAEDVNLQPRDILFVPDSKSKKAGIRAAETALQTVTGLVIWGRL